MHIPVNHGQALMGDFHTGDFHPQDHEDENRNCDGELHHARMADSSSGEGSGEGGSPVSSRGNGGCIRDRPVKVIPCPRCQSMNTKFCYYNNYSVNQPRHFCRNCQRYWTVGGTLRNVPVGGGSRKKTRTRSRSDTAAGPGHGPYAGASAGLLEMDPSSSCMQQLSLLPGFGPLETFAPAAMGSQLPFLQFALEQGGLQFPTHKGPLAGLQEVPDLQSLYDVPQVPQITHVNSPMLSNNGFFLPDVGASSDGLASAMAKAGLWSSSSPVQQLQALTGGSATQPPSWEDKTTTMNSSLSAYEDRKQPNATVLPQSWSSSKQQASLWDTSLLQQQTPQSRPMMHHDRLVPHASWDDSSHGTHRNVSPNGSNGSNRSNVTTEDDRCLPSSNNNCFSQGYHEDVMSHPWTVGNLQASDILFQ